MNRQYIANQIIMRKDRTSYHYRDQEKQNSAIISLLCGMVIGLTVLGCFCCKSCAPDPVFAYSLCEQCGGEITGEDHGRCKPVVCAWDYVQAIGDTEVAVCE